MRVDAKNRYGNVDSGRRCRGFSLGRGLAFDRHQSGFDSRAESSHEPSRGFTCQSSEKRKKRARIGIPPSHSVHIRHVAKKKSFSFSKLMSKSSMISEKKFTFDRLRVFS